MSSEASPTPAPQCRATVDYGLRDYCPADAAAVNAVVQAAFAQFRHGFSDWETFSRGLDAMVAMAEHSEIIVAERDGRIVGAVAYVAAGQPKKDFYPRQWPIVRLLVVSPEHRGHGIGRALTEACIARARRDGAPLIALHTSPLMAIALPLYLRMGFTLERELPAIFGVPYAIYVKRLSPPLHP